MSNDTYILYGYYRSSTTYRVRIALNLRNIHNYTTKPINLLTSEHTSNEAYQRLNPQQVVPTLVHNGRVLTQSVAICEYLNELPTADAVPLLPHDTYERALCRSIVNIIAADTAPVANMNVMKSVEQMAGADAKLKWAQTTISKGLLAVEAMLVKTSANKEYCIGDKVTLADVCLVPQVYNALRYEVDVSAMPTVMSVYKYLIKLKPFADAAPDNQIDAPKQ